MMSPVDNRVGNTGFRSTLLIACRSEIMLPRKIVFRVRLLVEKDEDGFYGYSPDLKCIHVYGKTEDEAHRHTVDAIEAYLNMSLKHGDPIPIGVESVERDKGFDVLRNGRRNHAAPPQEFIEDLNLAMA